MLFSLSLSLSLSLSFSLSLSLSLSSLTLSLSLSLSLPPRSEVLRAWRLGLLPCLGTGGQNHLFNLHYNGIIGYDIELSEVVEKGEEIDSDYHNTRRNGGAFDKLPK
jgi:hypothetical protein